MSVQSSADRGGYVLVKSFPGSGRDALRAVILAMLYAEKNDRKVSSIGMMAPSALKGDKCVPTAVSPEGPHEPG